MFSKIVICCFAFLFVLFVQVFAKNQTDYDEDHPFPSHLGHGPAVNECKEGECPLKNQDSCTADACKDYPPRKCHRHQDCLAGSAATNLAFCISLSDAQDVLEHRQSCAIIGAGISGLASARWALLYGLKPVLFERSSSIGGKWRYTSDPSHLSVMKSTVLNTSKEMTAFSDFPPPEHFPPYMQHPQMLEYLEMYAEHNHLLKYVRFETTVLNIARSNTHYKDGTWVVNYRTKSDTSQQAETFDCVLLAQGPHAKKNLPKWPNMENFKGRVIHSQDYKDFHGFEDAINVVVGIGNSAGDIAVDLSRVSQQTYISTRRGSWVVSRLGARGIPIDMQFTTRFLRSYLPWLLPQSILDWLGESKLQSRFDHAKYGLIPKHRLSQQQVTMNDELPGRIICGAIIVKPNISSFTPNGVIWEDGSTTQPVDNVILCTGYRPTFDLIEDGKLIRVTENKSCLYKHMYPAELLYGGDFDLNNKLQAPKAPSLAIIGLVHASGAITSVVEMQARLSFHYFCGRSAWTTTRAEAVAEVAKKEQARRLKYVNSPRYTFQLDYMAYMDEMAGVVGCLPKPWEYMLSDWRLAFSLIFKANLPYIYRLQGPHRWNGAREAIIKAEQRTDRGLKNL